MPLNSIEKFITRLKNRMNAYVTSILVLTLCRNVSPYSSGPPSSVCDGMTAGHGSPVQSSPSPYQLSANVQCFQPGQRILVTLGGQNGELYRGLLLQARKAGDNPAQSYGTFDVNGNSDLQVMNCFDKLANAISHSNGRDKSSRTIGWTAPNQPFNSNVKFTYTVVNSYSVYWVQEVFSLPECSEQAITSTQPDATTYNEASTNYQWSTTPTNPTEATTQLPMEATEATTQLPMETTEATTQLPMETTEATTQFPMQTTETTTQFPMQTTQTTTQFPMQTTEATTQFPMQTTTSQTPSYTDTTAMQSTTQFLPPTSTATSFSTTATTTSLLISVDPSCADSGNQTLCSSIGMNRCYVLEVKNQCCYTCAVMQALNSNSILPGCEYGDRISICGYINAKEYCKYYKEECCGTCWNY